MAARPLFILPATVLLVAVIGCPVSVKPDVEALRKPETCMECHSSTVTQWQGSMHAYAAEDPVFRAMNARGQRETNGELGDFCVRCHAPLAVALGATTDGLNLDELPQWMQGVTCYWCHATAAVTGESNNPLVIVEDGVMRGGIADPMPNESHFSQYSPLHDRTQLESSNLCGSCHDIVTPHGAHMERTFHEWKESLYANTDYGALTCGQCHMNGADARVVPEQDAPLRRVHAHTFPGVDVAITEWPEREAQLEQVQRFLSSSLAAEICVEEFPGGSTVTVTLENVAAGHSFPSGSTPDRRVWLEMHAYSGEAEVFTVGEVDAATPVKPLAKEDPNMWVFTDTVFDVNGDETHMLFEVADYESNLLPAPTAPFPTDPGYIQPHTPREFIIPGLPVDRVEIAVHVRPIGLEVIDELIETGDLDPELRDAFPTFTLSPTQLEWRADLGTRCVPQRR